MEHNGQLTFSDDPILSGLNEANRFIEEGNFTDAMKKSDELLSANPGYPGLVESYRTSKFWHNRKYEIDNEIQGKKKADYLMKQWEEFSAYAREKNMLSSTAYRNAMRYIFHSASKHYRIAFQNREGAADNLDLLMNLGICFLTLGEYSNAIEILEFARTSFKANAKLVSLLGEANFHINEIPRSILLFREAFFINPSDIDLSLLSAKPIHDLIAIVKARKPDCIDIREWIPVFGFTEDTFYVRRKLNIQQVETIKKEIYTLEESYQTQSRERIEQSNIIPRLINKYLWMLDYFENQDYNFENITQIRKRLVTIDGELFEPFFKRQDSRKK